MADSVTYDDEFPWPIGADALGAGDDWLGLLPTPISTAPHQYRGRSLERVSFDVPASDILHELSRYRHFGVRTFQAEDEIAACSAAIGASFAGQPAYLGVYLIGPGADLPPTVLQLSVASVHGCQALSQTTARL